MDLRDTPDDSLRHAAERGLAERAAHALAAYQAAEAALTAARERARWMQQRRPFMTDPPFVLEAWEARDKAYDALIEAEEALELNVSLRELAEAQEAAEWGRA